MFRLISQVAFVCALASFTASFAQAACPAAPGETELTLASVMQNFGRFLLGSDRVARSTPAQVSDADLALALTGIQGAGECAAIVYKDRSGKLYPSIVGSLEGAEKEEYLKSFFKHMGTFHQSLVDYEATFQVQIAAPAAQRDFAAIVKQREVVMKAAADAHRDLL